MPRYISLMSDFGFKHVFANPDHPHILINFIEAIRPELSIQSIEYIDTTQFADYVDDRTSIFDVFCRLHDGSFVIVEMQQVRQEHYVDRTILYASHVIQRQSQNEQIAQATGLSLEQVKNLRLSIIQRKTTAKSTQSPKHRPAIKSP